MIWSIVAGFMVGSLPTADLLSRARGVDLRASGSGNPGAANALRVGGKALGALVLSIDLAKGAVAAMAGWAIGGERAAIAAGLAAILGQVRNPWFRFRGGKGLAVTAGTALVLWPLGLAVTAPLVGLLAKPLRSAGAALTGLAWLLGASILWAARDWSTAWGVMPDDGLVWYAIGVVAITTPKLAASVGRTAL